MTEIEKRICICLFYIKLVLIALFIYLFVLTVSEGIFTLQSANPKAVGHMHVPKGGINKSWAFPKIKTNVVGVDVKNSLYKNQTNTLRSFVAVANVTEESLHLEYQ